MEILLFFPSCNHFFNTFFLILTPYSFSFLNPTIFPSSLIFCPKSFTFPKEMKTSQWEWSGYEYGNDVCVCVCLRMTVCFMTLSSVDERKEVYSVIYSHRPSCPICVSLHRFAVSHTHLPSLSHFSEPPSFAPHTLPPRPLLICLCVSDNSLTLAVSLHNPLLSKVSSKKALKPASSLYSLISIPIQMGPHTNTCS